MKKLIYVLMFALIPIFGYSQATPSKTVRVAARSTVFGVNLPAGTQIYCVADSTNWNVLAAGVASTRTITTAYGASEIEWIRTKVENSGTRGTVGYAIAIDSTKASYQSLVIGAATTSYAGVLTAADKTKLDGISVGAGSSGMESFANGADSITVTGSGYYTCTLTTAGTDSTAFQVSLNGVELRHEVGNGQYTVMVPDLAAKRVQINIPVYKYDVISVIYSK